MESPVHYSNVNLVDPVTGSPVRVGRKFLDDGTKVQGRAGGSPRAPSCPSRTSPCRDAGRGTPRWDPGTRRGRKRSRTRTHQGPASGAGGVLLTS